MLEQVGTVLHVAGGLVETCQFFGVNGCRTVEDSGPGQALGIRNNYCNGRDAQWCGQVVL